MWDWIKDKWEFLAAGVTVLFVFLLGRKSKNVDLEVVEDITESKNKEIEVIEKSAGEERLQKALARQKYSEAKLSLIKSRASAQNDLERQTIERKLELLELAKEDPDRIDRILMTEFNIAKLK
jgi:acyl CoA:acetate/3-ketoacid CoA transferase alpha subunit